MLTIRAVENGNYSVLDHGFTLNGLALIVLSLTILQTDGFFII